MKREGAKDILVFAPKTILVWQRFLTRCSYLLPLAYDMRKGKCNRYYNHKAYYFYVQYYYIT